MLLSASPLAYLTLSIMLASLIPLNGCDAAEPSDEPTNQPNIGRSHRTTAQTVAQTLPATRPPALWSGHFQGDWQTAWQVQAQGAWGEENLEIIRQSQGSVPEDKFPEFLRVQYPAGSASPAVSRKAGVPLGGSQFYATLGIAPQDRLRLSYSVRFPTDFDFVKGGKLPGLYGGAGNSGGNIPNGRDGFSSRLMWRKHGAGELYAYLPSSQQYGTALGSGNWRFQPGQWQRIEQELWLNQPGKADGRARIWVNGNLVLDQENLIFRTAPELKIDGIFFSTFFGGGDRSWATPKDTTIDFANFEISLPSPGDELAWRIPAKPHRNKD